MSQPMRTLVSLLIVICCGACSSSVDVHVHDAPPNVEVHPPPPPQEAEEEGAVPTGLVGHWKFDEGSGQVAKDASGGGDGTIHGASWTKGRMDGALQFSDPKTSVTIPNRPALNPPGPFEISLWVYIQERPLGFAALIEKGGGFGCSFRLLLLRNGHIRAALGTEHVTVDSSTAPSLSQWHLVEMIYTGRELQLKIDGQESAKREVTQPNLKSAFDVVIGRGLVGKIDDVKIVSNP